MNFSNFEGENSIPLQFQPVKVIKEHGPLSTCIQISINNKPRASIAIHVTVATFFLLLLSFNNIEFEKQPKISIILTQSPQNAYILIFENSYPASNNQSQIKITNWMGLGCFCAKAWMEEVWGKKSRREHATLNVWTKQISSPYKHNCRHWWRGWVALHSPLNPTVEKKGDFECHLTHVLHPASFLESFFTYEIGHSGSQRKEKSAFWNIILHFGFDHFDNKSGVQEATGEMKKATAHTSFGATKLVSPT